MNVLKELLSSLALAKLYKQVGHATHINQLFEERERIKGKPYSDATKQGYKSKLYTKGVIDDNGYFTPNFHEIVRTSAEEIKGSRARVNKYINEADIRSSIEVEDSMEYKDIFNILEKNPEIQFMYPSRKPSVSGIDFNKTSVQYVRLNNLSHYVRYPQYIKYISVCPRCGREWKILENKPIKCDKCNVQTKINFNISISRSCFVYMIDYRQEQYVARSLNILPMGDFNAAIIIVKDKNAYTMLIVCTSKPDKLIVSLKFKEGDILQQLVKVIDYICLNTIGKQIYGMTYYKYSIILSYLAALSGMTNYNIYICGSGGIGKTATARLYCATITEKTKVQDATNLTSGGGIRGTTQKISIGQTTYNVHEPGLLERHSIVVIDEILDMGGDQSDKAFLKSALSSSTLSTEVAGNRTEIKKNSTVIGTSNIPRWIKTRKLKSELKGYNFEIECSSNGIWFVDGQNLHFLDRFALLFYIDESETKADFNTNDQRISDVELRNLLYTPEIDNYLKQCSQIRVTIPEDIIKELEKLSSESQDPIHSTSRRDSYISMTTQLHAMVNGRNVANMNDVNFTSQMLRKCFRPINVQMLAEDFEEITHPLDIWALKTILAKIGLSTREQLRKECGRKYDTTNFDEVFEHARYYNEIIKVEKNKYRCSGSFD